jgi:hypothetical protein
LRPDPELVHVRAGHALDLGEVFGGLAHGHVDIGQLAVVARVVPRVGATLGALRGARVGAGEQRVLPRAADQRLRLVGQGVGAAPGGPRHALDPGGEEHVALAGLDRVERHAGGLQRGGAVPGDGRARQVVEAEQRADHAGHVEALLAAGQAAAQVEIFDVPRIELGDLVERGSDYGGGEVVRTKVAQRSLNGTADRGPGGGDNDSFRHGCHATAR